MLPFKIMVQGSKKEQGYIYCFHAVNRATEQFWKISEQFFWKQNSGSNLLLFNFSMKNVRRNEKNLVDMENF